MQTQKLVQSCGVAMFFDSPGEKSQWLPPSRNCELKKIIDWISFCVAE
jgi:hypothetical protein